MPTFTPILRINTQPLSDIEYYTQSSIEFPTRGLCHLSLHWPLARQLSSAACSLFCPTKLPPEQTNLEYFLVFL